MNKTAIRYIAAGSLLGLFATALLVAGCRTSHTEHAEATKPDAVTKIASSGKGGAQLWAENCIRCHNIRSPSIYSDAEWEVAMHHMRIRANLTAEEHKKILEFLKSAN
jgi:cytochrome c5